MALNIPNVGSPLQALLSGIKTGSGAYSNAMQPILEREKQRQAEERFKKEFALRKAAAGRNAALQPLREAVLQEQLKALKDKNDPVGTFKKYNQLLGLIDNNGNNDLSKTSTSQEMQSYFPSIENNFGQGQSNSEFKSFISSLIPNKTNNRQEEPNIPEINPNAISEYESAQSNSQNKPQGILDKEYLKKALLHKALGLPVPALSTSGYTPELRQKEFEYKQKSLNERMRHNEAMEKLADPEEKIRLAQEKANIEAEKQKIITDHKAESEYIKTLNKEEAKTYSKMQDEAITGIKSEPLLNEIKSIVNDPVLEQIRKHPNLGHYEVEYYRKNGTPEQKSLIARFDVAANKLIADTAKGLNTRFTDKDLALAREMKINDTDTLEAMKSKAESLIYLHDIGKERLEKALDISSTRRVSPFSAIKQADALIDGNKIREQIKKQISSSSKELPSGITEEDMKATQQITGLSRDQILADYKRKHGI